MNALCSMLIGYLLGSLSPSALIGKIKKVDLRKEGTKNLGASNTMIVFGKIYGALVMVFDIVKSYISVKIAEALFPAFTFAGILAGGASVVGHIYPFYLKFKGGKGLASFGGFVLALDPVAFLFLLSLALILMFAVNYGVAVPMSAGVLFPFVYGIRTKSLPLFLIALIVSALVVYKHLPNLGKAMRGEDMKVREILHAKK